MMDSNGDGDTVDISCLIEELSYNEMKLIRALDIKGGSSSPKDLVSDGEFELDVEVMGAASWLESKGLVKISKNSKKFYVLSDKSIIHVGLPERIAIKKIHAVGDEMNIADLATEMPEYNKIAIGWLKKKRLVDIIKNNDSKLLILNNDGKRAVSSDMPDEIILKRMMIGPISEDDVDPIIIKDLKSRQGIILEKIITSREISLTPLGFEVAKSGIKLKSQITDMTDCIIQSGKWREVDFRKYDIQTFAPSISPTKKHPLSRMATQIRRLFIEMGFTEMSSEYVQPAFWNLDILFTPQDHPARDLQDTFYLENPSSLYVKDEGLINIVKNIHENGWRTGSTGWGGKWSKDKAELALLRTHSTVSSIRYISEHPNAPQKAFSISRIFRKESIDITHLPEFTQIEGIIIDKNANFNTLLSVIKEFYLKMGFSQIRIRPAYFPYTEPSLELEVFFNGKWMELGGAGMFRPEVLAPFNVKYQVLAWGFGFERLAMLKWDVNDIRDLYISDIENLKGNKIV